MKTIPTNIIPIEKESWLRQEHFHHYLVNSPCTYSMTVKLDITSLKGSGIPLYPALLYGLAKTVNNHPEFRMTLTADGEPAYFEEMHPGYTLFHPDSETFSCLWTEYEEDFAEFLQKYQQDLSSYGNIKKFEGKPSTPDNVFNVSMIPWETFEGFNLNLKNDYGYLLPIFTLGRYTEESGRVLIPLAVQVHHAACDGWHVCRFLSDLREIISTLTL